MSRALTIDGPPPLAALVELVGLRFFLSRDEPRGEDCAASQPGANVTVPGLPCGRTGAERADDATRPVPRKPPGREGPGKQTSHQLIWKVNRPGGRRPLEAGWARERCGSRPSLSSSLESQPDRRAGTA
jgi:hypothetical protein